jgi:hypothetical protein
MANANATADVKPSEYREALNRWSGTEKVYDKLETRLIVSSTYKSAAFRDAWADEYSRRYLLSDADRDELKRREHADAESYHEFFFAAYTPESRWNDFSKRESIWKLRLFDDAGNSTEPLVVTKIKNDDPKLHAFFPYFTLWTKGYIVKFPKSGLSSDSKSLRIQFASALGAAELTLDRSGADTASPVRVENGGGSTASVAPVPAAVVAPAPAPAP